MSLYDRNNAYDAGFEVSETKATSMVRDTYKLIVASLIAATAGAYIGMQTLQTYNWILFLIVELALLFGMQYAVSKAQNTLALVLMFAFTFITGFSLGPILNAYIGMGAGHVITNALLTTTIAFGTLTVFAIKTNIDTRSWGKPLFFVLIGVIIAGILNILFFKSTMGSLAISSVTALLFGFYIIYDTQNIFKGVYDSPILAAVNMYLNILNLFISLLNILGITSRD